MNYSRILPSVALLTVCSLIASPALAQRGGGHSRGSSVSRGSSGGGARSAAPARTYSGSRVYGAPSRSYTSPSRAYSAPTRAYSGPARAYSAPSRAYNAVPRAGVGSRSVYATSRGAAVVRGGYGSRAVYVAPSHFFRPYYTFHPRFSLGFGLWVGFPIAYSYPYYYGFPYAYAPYAYPYAYGPYAYGPYPYSAYGPSPAYGYVAPNGAPVYPGASYPPAGAPQPGYYNANVAPGSQGSIAAQPGGATGSLSFEISPSSAEVYIDGQYSGLVSDFGPTTQPIALTPGRHHVEIRAQGYQTLSIDADVIAGQVIPYQGTMQQVR